MRCEDIMKNDVKCCLLDDPVDQIAQKMRDHNIGFVPICDEEDHVLGTITDRDLAIRVIAEGKPANTRAEDAMTREVVACKASDDLSRAAELMKRHQKSRILCVDDDDRLVGVISLSDLAQSADDDRIAETMRGVTEREAPTVH